MVVPFLRSRIVPQIEVTFFSPKQRVVLLGNGLRDQDETIRKACSLALNGWIRGHYKSNLLSVCACRVCLGVSFRGRFICPSSLLLAADHQPSSFGPSTPHCAQFLSDFDVLEHADTLSLALRAFFNANPSVVMPIGAWCALGAKTQTAHVRPFCLPSFPF